MHLMLLFQNTGPQSFPYLILGYVIIGTVGLGYVLTLWWRQRGSNLDGQAMPNQARRLPTARRTGLQGKWPGRSRWEIYA